MVPELEDAVIGKYFTRMNRTTASLRGRVSQGESYFLDHPNRNNQVRVQLSDQQHSLCLVWDRTAAYEISEVIQVEDTIS